ncbi:hypothetical protein AAVH_10192 [Aphelenchoides avenae]|nr:hypothetical protein AAVH_10192 [Aphelenchus avenae]
MEKLGGRGRKGGKKRKGKGAKEEKEAAQPQKTEPEPPNKTTESPKKTGGTNTDGTCDSTALESELGRPNAQAVPAGEKSKSAPINIANTGL